MVWFATTRVTVHTPMTGSFFLRKSNAFPIFEEPTAPDDRENPDLGRFDQTKVDKDRGAFKTPTIRNVCQSAPFMHDDSQAILEAVVDWYDKGGHPNPYLSDKIKKLNRNAQEKENLVPYMKSLTGELPKVREDRLPN